VTQYDLRHYRFLRQQPPEMKDLPWAEPTGDVPFWESGAGAVLVGVIVTLVLWGLSAW